MSQLLSAWLRSDCSVPLDPSQPLERAFANGHLFATLFQQYGVLSAHTEPLSSFRQHASTAQDKLFNYRLLQPVFSALGVPLTAHMANSLMTETPGTAPQVLLSLKAALEAPTTISQPASYSKAGERHFGRTLRTIVANRDAASDESLLLARFQKRGEQFEAWRTRELQTMDLQHEKTLRLGREDTLRHDQQKMSETREKAAVLEQRHRQSLKAKTVREEAEVRFETKKKISEEKRLRQRNDDAARDALGGIEAFEHTLANTNTTASSSSSSSSSSSTATATSISAAASTSSSSTYNSGNPAVDAYLDMIGTRRRSEEEARKERALRRRKYAVEQGAIQAEMDAQHRNETLLQRLYRKASMEASTAAQLAAVRREKEVMRENRLVREEMYAKAREDERRREEERNRDENQLREEARNREREAAHKAFLVREQREREAKWRERSKWIRSEVVFGVMMDGAVQIANRRAGLAISQSNGPVEKVVVHADDLVKVFDELVTKDDLALEWEEAIKADAAPSTEAQYPIDAADYLAVYLRELGEGKAAAAIRAWYAFGKRTRQSNQQQQSQEQPQDDEKQEEEAENSSWMENAVVLDVQSRVVKKLTSRAEWMDAFLDALLETHSQCSTPESSCLVVRGFWNKSLESLFSGPVPGRLPVFGTRIMPVADIAFVPKAPVAAASFLLQRLDAIRQQRRALLLAAVQRCASYKNHVVSAIEEVVKHVRESLLHAPTPKKEIVSQFVIRYNGQSLDPLREEDAFKAEMMLSWSEVTNRLEALIHEQTEAASKYVHESLDGLATAKMPPSLVDLFGLIDLWSATALAHLEVSVSKYRAAAAESSHAADGNSDAQQQQQAQVQIQQFLEDFVLERQAVPDIPTPEEIKKKKIPADEVERLKAQAEAIASANARSTHCYFDDLPSAFDPAQKLPGSVRFNATVFPTYLVQELQTLTSKSLQTLLKEIENHTAREDEWVSLCTRSAVHAIEQESHLETDMVSRWPTFTPLYAPSPAPPAADANPAHQDDADFPQLLEWTVYLKNLPLPSVAKHSLVYPQFGHLCSERLILSEVLHRSNVGIPGVESIVDLKRQCSALDAIGDGYMPLERWCSMTRMWCEMGRPRRMLKQILGELYMRKHPRSGEKSVCYEALLRDLCIHERSGFEGMRRAWKVFANMNGQMDCSAVWNTFWAPYVPANEEIAFRVAWANAFRSEAATVDWEGWVSAAIGQLGCKRLEESWRWTKTN